MRTASATVVLLLALAVGAPSAQAQTSPSHYYCFARMSGRPGQPDIVYASQIIVSAQSMTAMSHAWQKFIVAKYPEHASTYGGRCRDFGSTFPVQQMTLRDERRHYAAHNWTVIPVNYVPSTP